MANEFFISDTHFFHNNIIDYCGRPFANAEEMNEAIVRNWNSIVAPDDVVHHLGDFVLGQADHVPQIIDRLNGHIILCRGNHDTKAKLALYAQRPDKITVKDIDYVEYKGLFFVGCHFPMTNEEFLKMVSEDNSEVVVVHGHVHEKADFYTPETHVFNVSADVTNFSPVPISLMYELVRQDFIEKGVWRGK